MGRFIELISFEDAVSRIHSTEWKQLGIETVEPENSVGRITSETVMSVSDVPKWNRSLVDGYAVKSSDCSGASDVNPVVLDINGLIEAGASSYTDYRRNACTEIYTGGIIPSDYDSVVMAEDVERSDNSVRLSSVPKIGDNIQYKGEEIKEKTSIVEKAHRIRPWDITAMMSSGVKSLKVYKRLKIGIISTGNELFEGSQGHIPNTTMRIYTDYLRQPFLDSRPAGISHDDTDEIRNYIKNALEKYDCVIVTGGTSLGGKDDVPEAMDGIGNVIFAGSMIRPGRTLTLYEAEGKPVFSVSGIPVPSLISFDLYFEEYLKHITGLVNYRQEVTGTLTTAVSNVTGYAGIYRVRYSTNNGEAKIEVVRTRGSGSIDSIMKSNATLMVPGAVEGHPAGAIVTVKLYGDAT